MAYNINLPESIEKIKIAVSIKELIEEEGITLHQNGHELVGYHSNKHDSVSKTSLHVNPIQGIYYCFNCGEGGDIFTWLIKNRNVSFTEALHQTAQRAGIELPYIDPEQQQMQNMQRQEQESLWELFTAAAEEYNAKLGEQNQILLLDKWGLTAETAKRLKIGYAPGGKFIYQKLQECGFCEELIERSGLINKGGYDHFQKRLVFPYWKNARVVFFIARRIDGVIPDNEYEQAKFKKLLVHSEKNPHVSKVVRNEYFAGEDTALGAEKLIITEGIADCYAAIQAGFNCISPVTVKFRKDDTHRLALLARRAKTVFICNDNEENKVGEKGALVTAEYLESQGINVKLIELPRPAGVGKIDLAEFLRDNTVKAFQEIMNQAKTLLNLSLDRLAQSPEDTELRGEVTKKIAKIDSSMEQEAGVNELVKILKPVGIGKTVIKKEIAKLMQELQDQGYDEVEKETQADYLIRIAENNLYLFHDETKDSFACIGIKGHQEIWALRSRLFRQWLVRQFYEQTDKSPNSEAVRQALGVIEAQAVFDGPEHKLHLRVVEHSGAIWYDLANEKWQVVKITTDGWSVVDSTPVPLFRRYKNTAP